MTLVPCSREIFVNTPRSDGDSFAKTFISKADARDLWGNTMGLFNTSLEGAITLTFTKREPTVANIQLLHVFSHHRGKGVGRELVNWALKEAFSKASYIRVSSEPSAQLFYEKLGFFFWGKQKSGTLLSISKLEENKMFSDIRDSTIYSAVLGNRKGCLSEEEKTRLICSWNGSPGA